jgi:hypothetical protein
MAEAQNN